MQAWTANWEVLKTNLTGGSRRSNSITSALPSRHPTRNASALQKIKPNTIGMSPSENECAPRRKWRWTTQRSAIANAIAIDHQDGWHRKFGRAVGVSLADVKTERPLGLEHVLGWFERDAQAARDAGAGV